MIIKYGDAETINVIQPVDVADEVTKNKLDELKDEMKDKLPICDPVTQGQE